jgi:UDPglucose--hexose-1-phosphate uridylyltransferase
VDALMTLFDLQLHPHKRRNPLTGQWVIVSPRRLDRPWRGQTLDPEPGILPRYDPTCYLCPGNLRAGGSVNPPYPGTFVFDNDFPGLRPDPTSGHYLENDLFEARSERGLCRVLCFDPRHDLTLPKMEPESVVGVVTAWVRQSVELNAVPWVGYVQIFENRGAMMGCSNPHPHCQIWATETLPDEVEKEDRRQSEFLVRHGDCLLCRYLEHERRSGERVVFETSEHVVLVPFWAVWPYETLVLPKAHVAGFSGLNEHRVRDLADCLRRLTIRYDNLFQSSLPYSMGFHQAPSAGNQAAWHLHAHFYPPALRSATIRKYMVGFEMLGTPQRDISAETAAARLRELSDRHYMHG